MSTLISRNISLAGRRTSLRLERAVWDALDEIAQREGRTINEICSLVDRMRTERTLTASVRVYVLDYYRAAATPPGHAAAGHGLLPEERVTAPPGPVREDTPLSKSA